MASFRRINWAQIDPLLFTGTTTGNTVTAALTYFEYPFRYEGLTAYIKVNSEPIIEFWFKGGIEDSNFVPKLTGGGGGSNINFIPHTGLEYTGYSFDARTIYNTALSPILTSPEKVGGFPLGTSVASLTGKTLVGIIDDLLFPTVLPTYTIPTIAISSAISTVKEVGSSISPLLVLDGVKNDADAFTLLNILSGSTIIATTLSPAIISETPVPDQFEYPNPNNPNYRYRLAYTDPGRIIPATTTTSPSLTQYKGNGTYGAGLPKQNNKNVTDVRPYAIRSVNAPQSGDVGFTSNTITIYGYYPYFYGNTAVGATPDDIVNIIQSGSGFVKVVADSDGTLSMNFNAVGQWPWFAIFNPYPNKTKWEDANNALNNGNIGLTLTDLFSAPTSKLVNSPDIYWNGISFKIYVAQKITTLGTCLIKVI